MQGRRAVVLLTDGVDTTSHASYDGTLRLAEQSQVSRPELVVQARDSYVYTRPKSDDKEAGRRPPKEAEAPRRLLEGVRWKFDEGGRVFNHPVRQRISTSLAEMLYNASSACS